MTAAAVPVKGATASMPAVAARGVGRFERQELVAGGVGQQHLDIAAAAVGQGDAGLAGAVQVGGHDVARLDVVQVVFVVSPVRAGVMDDAVAPGAGGGERDDVEVSCRPPPLLMGTATSRPMLEPWKSPETRPMVVRSDWPTVW